MGQLIREFDWSKTDVGPIDTWPQSLRTAISIVLNSDFPMFIWWGEKSLTNFYNDAYSIILGKKHPSALGQSGKSVWSEIWNDVGPLASQVMTTGRPILMEDLPLKLNRYGHAEQTYFTFSYSCLRDETGAIGGMFCVCTETTSQVISKQKLSDSEKQLVSILDSMSDAFFVLDKEFKFVRVNRIQEKLSGTHRQDTLGKNFWKVFPTIAVKTSKYWTEFHKVIELNKAVHFTDYYSPLNIWTEVDAYPTKQGGMSVFFRDVSERKNSEAERQRLINELKVEKSRLSDAFEFAPAFLAVLQGKDHTFIMANKSYYQLVGHRDIIGKTLIDALPEIRGQGYKELLDDVYSNGKPFTGKEMKVLLQLEPGSELVERFVDIIYQPMRDIDGKTIGIYAFGYDVSELVTARQQVEKSEIALRNSEKRFRTLIEKSTDAIQLVNPDGEIIYSSESVKNVLGYTSKELQGKIVATYVHPDDLELLNKKLVALLRTPQKSLTFQYRVKHKDGSWAWVETTGVNHLHTPNIKALVGTFRNITDRKKSEEVLQQQLSIINAVTDMATACLFMIDGEGLVTFLNPSAQIVTGYSQADAIGKPMHSLVHHSHPDGTPYPESDCPLVNTYRHGEPSPLHEDIFYRKDGTPFNALIIGTRISGVPGMQGTVVEFRDITEEKRAEKELRELIVITEQRNALIKINKTKDEFIGMASHQLRTPATAVKQYIGLLLDNFAGPLTPEQTQYLKVAYDSNERELNIINDLLKTALISTDKYRLNKELCNVAELISDCLKDLRLSFKQKNQNVVFNKPSDDIMLQIDVTEMKLALTNLLENASKYSFPDSDILISLKRNEKYIVIDIKDNGVGVSPENHQRIFDKFTRVDNVLSDTVTGTGLGLFWVKQIIELHKGKIKLESSLGNGSTFKIRLPR